MNDPEEPSEAAPGPFDNDTDDSDPPVEWGNWHWRILDQMPLPPLD